MSGQTFFPFYQTRAGRIADTLWRELPSDAGLPLAVRRTIEEAVCNTLHAASVRTLIYEMHVSLDDGRISGSTPEQEYEDFCGLLEKESFRAKLLGKYPALASYLKHLENNQYTFWKEVLARYLQDRKELAEVFSAVDSPDREMRLAGVECSGSDSHLGGRSVVRFRAENGACFYYKPHTMANEIWLQKLLKRIYGDLGWEKYVYPILDREVYGWVGEIRPQECTAPAQVEEFYEKTGVLAAVSYLLGIGDLHYENLIARGSEPVIVDADTLFQYGEDLYRWDLDRKPFYTVLTGGLFPGGTAGADLCGVTGGRGELFGRQVPVVLYDKTSRMQIGYERPRMKPGKNLCLCQGKTAEPALYTEKMEEGFGRGYRWFQKNGKRVWGELAEAQDRIYCRHLSGGTQFFGLAINASTHPSLLGKTGDREAYLERLCSGRPCRKEETEAMAGGDVPWFFRKPGDRHLYSGSGVCCENYFPDTVLDQVKRRLEGMSEEDCRLQQRLIGLSGELFGRERSAWMNTVREDLETDRETVKAPAAPGTEASVWQAYALALADRMEKQAIRQGDRVWWLRAQGEEDRLGILPVDLYLYSGIAGIAVFFGKIRHIFGVHGELCEKLEKELSDYTDRLEAGELKPQTDYTGMYCGESSVAFACQLLYEITGEEKYLSLASRHLRVTAPLLEKDRKYDLTYGNAGAVLILCRQYEMTGEEYWMELARSAMRVLENGRTEDERGVCWKTDGEKSPICSMAHGNSGILLAYARMYALTGKGEYAVRMREIVDCEDQYLDPVSGNWADLRKEDGEKYAAYAWCNGGVGVVCARLTALAWNPGQTWLMERAKKGIRLFAGLPLRKGMCLCHGNMGNLLIMGLVKERTDNEQVKKRWKEWLRMLGTVFDRPEGPLELMQENFGCGLMDGASGVGLACLLLAGKMPGK